nr:MAG TPA: hypothetical protein [Caudoviricetes sp.]DAZ66854.1 MAG TPA: hypothetical protein [Caudoviricetes sp.]
MILGAVGVTAYRSFSWKWQTLPFFIAVKAVRYGRY